MIALTPRERELVALVRTLAGLLESAATVVVELSPAGAAVLHDAARKSRAGMDLVELADLLTKGTPNS